MAEKRHTQCDVASCKLCPRSAIGMVAALAIMVAVGCQPEETAYTMPDADPATPPSTTSPTDKPTKSAENAAAKPARIVDKTFDDIKFDIEPDAPYEREMLTDEIEELVGQRIRIRGYIYPTLQRDGLKAFVLVRDNQECCFGPGAALYDCIRVEMVPGNTASFSTKPVSVEGEFLIDELEFDGITRAVFLMKGEKVR
ncbi:hypothetical protein NG895_25255 [Aeoliella sp. ICT_H6.2]|uniref:DUF3299 domain-containing protein n=1 Tax=Aeoliella straminimaris TaxID=2954799 RepID=A0A9X2FJI8_9BACT|nr:hypothetical protein [Aeoliella straminimaris]MCO6047221.1 hypothetical protein [Aeoliella straminimaris]